MDTPWPITSAMLRVIIKTVTIAANNDHVESNGSGVIKGVFFSKENDPILINQNYQVAGHLTSYNGRQEDRIRSESQVQVAIGKSGEGIVMQSKLNVIFTGIVLGVDVEEKDVAGSIPSRTFNSRGSKSQSVVFTMEHNNTEECQQVDDFVSVFGLLYQV